MGLLQLTGNVLLLRSISFPNEIIYLRSCFLRLQRTFFFFFWCILFFCLLQTQCVGIISGSELKAWLNGLSLLHAVWYWENIKSPLSFTFLFSKMGIIVFRLWTSLVVRWLGLCVPSVQGLGSILGQGTRSHMPQLRVHMLQLKILNAAIKMEDTVCRN